MGTEFSRVEGFLPSTRSAGRRHRLLSYPRPWRRSIARITANAPYLEDLADSFPALLFALVCGYGTAERRQRARNSVAAGLPLKVAAEDLGLPMWLRRLPPQAFSAPFPVIPLDPEFAIAIASRMPSRTEDANVWLGRVLDALSIAGREVALWIAKGPRILPLAATEEDFRWTLAYAWHSAHPAVPIARLIRSPWSPAMTCKKAGEEVATWRKRIDLAAALGSGLADLWFADGCAHGLEFVALRTVDDFIAEGAAMENCLDQYAPHLTYGRVRVFSVRKDGRRIADLELSLRSDEDNMPAIGQLRGPRNRRAPTRVWQAVHAWLGAQPFRALKSTPANAAEAQRVLRGLWRPYAEALDVAGLIERLQPSVRLPAPGKRRRPRVAAKRRIGAGIAE